MGYTFNDKKQHCKDIYIVPQGVEDDDNLSLSLDDNEDKTMKT